MSDNHSHRPSSFCCSLQLHIITPAEAKAAAEAVNLDWGYEGAGKGAGKAGSPAVKGSPAAASKRSKACAAAALLSLNGSKCAPPKARARSTHATRATVATRSTSAASASPVPASPTRGRISKATAPTTRSAVASPKTRSQK